MKTRWRIVILGHGPAALRSVLSLDRAIFSRDDLDVTLVSARDSHDVVPLLPEVLAGRRTADLATIPIERLLARRQVTLALGDEPTVDPSAGVVSAGSAEHPYNALILCPVQARPASRWAGAVALTSAADVARLRSGLTERVRHAAWSLDPIERRRSLTVVVVGAGWAGVVWSGAIAVALRRMALSLRLRADAATVHLVEAGERVLPHYNRAISANAGELLGRAGVTSRLRTRVTGVSAGRVALSDGEIIEAATVVDCTGWTGADWLALPESALDAGRRVVVDRRMRTSLPGFVFACGDGVALSSPGLNSPPAPWEFAIRQADVAAANALAAASGRGEHQLPDVGAALVVPIGEWALATAGPVVLAGPLANLRAGVECARYLEGVGGAAAVLSSVCGGQ